MPVDERTFVPDVKSWVEQILARRPDLPYERASVEEHTVAGRERLDFLLYRRGPGNRIALTGEIKMPDSPQGKRGPLDGELVEDAFEKASRRGSPFYFTWNVREFVLFRTHVEGVPFMQRGIEGPRLVVDISLSDDVRRVQVQEAIAAYWESFLERLAAIESGARLIELPLDRRFILRLEATLEHPIAATIDEIDRRYENDAAFRSALNAWMVEEGWEVSVESETLRANIERAARLSCYTLVNRLVFYEVLRRRFRALPALVGMQPGTAAELATSLSRLFGTAIEESRDYETIFQLADFGTGLALLSPDSPEVWIRVARDIEDFDFSRLDYDVIGRMYEQLIGPAERRRYGQFYTAPEVVDLINAFCIRTAGGRLLDPACGGGTFLVRAYARKRALAVQEGRDLAHHELLTQISGTDIAAFPAQLSTINLAVRHLSDEANYPQVAQKDFFEVRAGVSLMRLPALGDGAPQEVVIDELDAVVGNPPYLRQEQLTREQKQRLAALIGQEWRGPGRPSFSGRSDIYVYFFAHAGFLLRSGGYLGLVTSVGWLDTEYGFRLQEFFLNHFKIIAVIESQVDKWFEDARVTTAVTILQREPDEVARRTNRVRFIQLRRPLREIYSEVLQGPVSEASETARQADMDAVRSLIEEMTEDETTDYWRVRVRSQGELWDEGCRVRVEQADDEDDEPLGATYKAGKWGQYLRAPDVWFDLLDRAGANMVPLYDLAKVRFGFKTGVDRFFCVRDVTARELARSRTEADFTEKWGISHADTRRIRIVRDGENGLHLVEARYLEPEFHSLMEANRIVIRPADVARLVVNAPVPPARLRNSHLQDYVRYAEQRGWNRGSTVQSRARSGPWYDLKLRRREERAHMFWPKSQQYRHIVPWNGELLPGSNNLYDTWARDGVNARALWAVLNSTVVALAKHQFGRMAGIEGNLKTEVVDVNMMLVPDPRTASPALQERLSASAERIAARLSARILPEEFDQEDRRELDDAVLELLGFEDAEERMGLRGRIYVALREQYQATRDRELVAQRDRSRGRRRGQTPNEIADEIWGDLSPDLGLLEFPRDFVRRRRPSRSIDLPAGAVEVGIAMLETGRQMRVGTIRVGGPTGQIIEVGSVEAGRFLAVASECGHYGPIEVPDDAACDEAVRDFEGYRDELSGRFQHAAAERTRDPVRQRSIAAALMRKSLNWRRD